MKQRPAMLAVLAVVVLSLAGALPAFADLSLSGGDSAQVAFTEGDGVMVRAEPGTNGGIITSLPEGYAVTIDDGPYPLDDGSNWYLVSAETPDGAFSGWIHADFLSGDAVAVTPDDGQGDAPAGISIVIGTGDEGLNLRDAPSLASNVLLTMPEGVAVELLTAAFAEADGVLWSEVSYDGVVGYSAAGFIGTADIEMAGSGEVAAAYGASMAAVEMPTIGDTLVSEAMLYLGVPYVWGGSEPDGFDCSGFTYFIVNEVLGNDFPRDLDFQMERGIPVERDELTPGDLVFFENTYKEGLSHIGFYMGDGQFINATGRHSSVHINSLDEQYWSDRYLTARRVA